MCICISTRMGPFVHQCLYNSHYLPVNTCTRHEDTRGFKNSQNIHGHPARPLHLLQDYQEGACKLVKL